MQFLKARNLRMTSGAITFFPFLFIALGNNEQWVLIVSGHPLSFSQSTISHPLEQERARFPDFSPYSVADLLQ